MELWPSLQRHAYVLSHVWIHLSPLRIHDSRLWAKDGAAFERSEAMQDEIFGPVLPMVRFRDLDEATGIGFGPGASNDPSKARFDDAVLGGAGTREIQGEAPGALLLQH